VVPAYFFLVTITYNHPVFQSPRLELLAFYAASYVVTLLAYRRLLQNFDTPVKRWLTVKPARADKYRKEPLAAV
jgi:hypothetical protein